MAQTKFKIKETPEYLLAVSDEPYKKGECFVNLGNRDTVSTADKDANPLVKDYCKKIIAYQPKGNAPKLDLPLLPEVVIEDDVDILFEKECEGWSFTPRGKIDCYKWFEKGYKASTKVYSEDDLSGHLMVLGNWIIKNKIKSGIEILSKIQEIIQSLKQPKTPMWFVAEMEEQRTATYGGVIVRELKTTTNSEGKQVLAGIYKL